jgi:hypothetical protein
MATGFPSTNILGTPLAIVAAAHLGLYPGALGFLGFPCIVTKDPTVAAGNALGPTLTVAAPIAITPGGGGKPLTDDGIPTVAIGTGIKL